MTDTAEPAFWVWGELLTPWSQEDIENWGMPKEETNPTKMRRFIFRRLEDVSGLSGEGVVVEGVEFSNGWVALTWRTPLTSVCFYPSIKTAIEIHGHEGSTVLEWIDD